MVIATHRDCLEYSQGLKQKQADDKKDENLPMTLDKSHQLKKHNTEVRILRDEHAKGHWVCLPSQSQGNNARYDLTKNSQQKDIDADQERRLQQEA